MNYSARTFTHSLRWYGKIECKRGEGLIFKDTKDLSSLKRLVCQTIWSDFAHISVFPSNIKLSEDDSSLRELVDTTNISNIVFQNTKLFDLSSKNDEVVSKGNLDGLMHEYFFNEVDDSESTMIVRIPEEFDLRINTQVNSLEIHNPEFTKLSSINEVRIISISNDLNKTVPFYFKARKIQANLFDFSVSRSSHISIMSSIEAHTFTIKSRVEQDLCSFFIKKLGITKFGTINLSGKIEAASIFASNLEINSKLYTTIKIGNIQIQERLTINQDEGELIIDSLEANILSIESGAKEIAIFCNKIGESASIKLTNPTVKFFLFINEDSISDINVRLNSKDIHFSSIRDSPSILIESLSISNISIQKLSSWEYLKQRILIKQKSKDVSNVKLAKNK